jgi:hypothetical protein
MSIRKTPSKNTIAAMSRRDVLRVGGLMIPAAIIAPTLLSGTAQAATFDYYISPSGSDSNPGTSSQPWSIAALNSKRSTYRGKRVGLLPGTYNISSMYAAGDYEQPILDVEGSSSSTSPTLIGAVTPQAAIIDSGLKVSDRAAMGNSTSVTQGNLIIDGLVFTRSVCRCLKLGSYVQSAVTGIVVRNCEFKGCDARYTPVAGGNNSVLELMNQTGALIQNNYFHDNIGEILNSGDHHSAILGWKCRNNIFEYNTVVKSGSVFGKAEGHSGNIFRFNYIDVSHLTDTTAALQDWCGSPTTGGNTTKIHNNVLIGGSAADLRSAYFGTQYTAHPVEVYNNTMVVLARAASFGLLIRTDPGALKFYNNIVTSAASGDQAFAGANVDAPSVMNFNLYHRAGGTTQWATYSSKTSTSRNYVSSLSLLSSVLRLISGSGVDQNSMVNNPMFVASGTFAAYYKLQSGSPAKGAGRVGGTSSGATTDMGAWGNGASGIGADFNAVLPAAPVLTTVS